MTKGHFDQTPLPQEKQQQNQNKTKYFLLFIHISIYFNHFQKAFAPNVLFLRGY